ncbi:MAG TPA: hypothetical protein VNX25_09930 [Verrucomicrobiae bacterium]|nr:hypothetical protein [Verrucomicrobiae bacterium]
MEEARVAMTVESVAEMLREAGAKVAARSGRSDSYGAPRDFSFEVRGLFDNGMELRVTARQFNYRDPWEAQGRVNDLVDAALLRHGAYSPLPKGFPFFQGRDQEEGLDFQTLKSLVGCVAGLNPRIYELQELTGML